MNLSFGMGPCVGALEWSDALPRNGKSELADIHMLGIAKQNLAST
ncbi:hypothetical protein BLA14095_00620 [Burkholderia lata]|nr:hypothetical protein BLA14095_00620 [Burkholderia lata]